MQALVSILILATLLAVVTIPFMPGLFEILRPSDDRPLALDRSYARDPFVLAREFRAEFQSLLAIPSWRHTSSPSKDVRLASVLRIANGGHERRAVFATTSIETGTEARLGNCYARQSVTLGPNSRARAVLTEGSLRLMYGSSIERWCHSAVDTYAEAACDLGRSATSEGTLNAERGVRFQRVHGNPVCTYADVLTSGTAMEQLVLAGEEGPLVTNGDCDIPAGTVIHGSIRSRAAVRVGSAAQVHGNVIASGEIVLEPHAIVLGHVSSPADIRLGANSRVGSSLNAKTVYGSRVVLAAGVRVFGSIVTNRGGLIE